MFLKFGRFVINAPCWNETPNIFLTPSIMLVGTYPNNIIGMRIFFIKVEFSIFWYA